MSFDDWLVGGGAFWDPNMSSVWMDEDPDQQNVLAYSETRVSFLPVHCDFNGSLVPVSAVVQPGDTTELAFKARVTWPTNLGRFMVVRYVFHDAAGEVLSSGASTQETVMPDSWASITYTTPAAPAGAAYVTFVATQTVSEFTSYFVDDVSIIVNP